MEFTWGGLYEHYKGKRYRLHCMVKHSETLEDLVFYEALYENPEGKMWVRPAKMWNETVTVNGKTIPRFRLLDKVMD